MRNSIKIKLIAAFYRNEIPKWKWFSLWALFSPFHFHFLLATSVCILFYFVIVLPKIMIRFCLPRILHLKKSVFHRCDCVPVFGMHLSRFCEVLLRFFFSVFHFNIVHYIERTQTYIASTLTLCVWQWYASHQQEQCRIIWLARLVDFNSIFNSYVCIFFALGKCCLLMFKTMEPPVIEQSKQ